MFALSLTVLAIATTASGKISPTLPYMHRITLTPDPSSHVVELFWNFTEKHITFEVHGNTTGWIGIGLSPGGGMIGADIFVGWVKNGRVRVTDRHGITDRDSFPPLDTQQNIDVIGGWECDGWTVIKFSRQLAACETRDTKITEGTQRVIWAMGEIDPTGDDIEQGDYHRGARGIKSVYLLSPSNKVLEEDLIGPEFKTFDIVAEEFQLPPRKTHYNCKIIELPPLNKKHHIVKFEPVIQRGNEAFVHHILVMSCGRKIQGSWKVGNDRTCASTDPTIFCLEVMFQWGVGGTSSFLPEESGISIGNHEDPLYVMLQTHYDNPDELAGVIDSSGIRIVYTPNVRRYDSGVFVVGQTVAGSMHYIPPRADNFLTIASCQPECLGRKMAEAGVESITVHQVLLHSHLAGRSMRFRHFRNGTELSYIARDETYNFNYQEYQTIDPFVTVFQNDTLQMECVYSTSERDFVTEGGDGTIQEMCFGFVAYYPKFNFSNCQSNIPPYFSWKYFGIQNAEGESLQLDGYNITSPAEFAGKTPKEVVSQYTWTEESIKDFNAYLHIQVHQQFCVGNDVSDIDIYKFSLPTIETPYISPERSCSDPSSQLKQTLQISDCPCCGSNIVEGSFHTCISLMTFSILVIGNLEFPRW